MGRKRKLGQREPNGRLQRPTTLAQIEAAARAKADAERATVLAQPHRRGERSELAECALGRFCLANRLDRALFDAAEAYAAMKRKWLAAMSAPLPDRLGGSGADIEMARVREWADTILAWETAMRDAGGNAGLVAVVWMAFDRFDCPPNSPRGPIIAALEALAKAQGRMEKNNQKSA